MAFSRNDIIRLLLRLGLSTTHWAMVSAKMDELEQLSEIVISNVLAKLDKLETLDKQLSEVLATPNFAIVSADVLEYGAKQKPYGILMEMLRVTQELGNLINITPNPSLINEQLALVDAPPTGNIVGGITRN